MYFKILYQIFALQGTNSHPLQKFGFFWVNDCSTNFHSWERFPLGTIGHWAPKKRYPRHVTAPIRINVCYFTNWARYRILDTEDGIELHNRVIAIGVAWGLTLFVGLCFAGSVVEKSSKDNLPNRAEKWWFTLWFTIEPSICLMILRFLSVRPGDINYVSWVMHEKSLVFQSYLLRFWSFG